VTKLKPDPETGVFCGPRSEGMTLRDWFAGMALASAVHLGIKTLTLEQLAYTMYAMADAMIAEREKEDKQ